jgi:hypothetical protein
MEGLGEFIETAATVIIYGVIAAFLIGLVGFGIGYQVGHDSGIEDCNNETIRKQLGL